MNLQPNKNNPIKKLEVEAEISRVQGQPQLHSKFEVSLGYTRPCVEKKKGLKKWYKI